MARADATTTTAATGDAHASPQVGGGFRHTCLEAGEAATFRLRPLRIQGLESKNCTFRWYGYVCVGGGAQTTDDRITLAEDETDREREGGEEDKTVVRLGMSGKKRMTLLEQS